MNVDMTGRYLNISTLHFPWMDHLVLEAILSGQYGGPGTRPLPIDLILDQPMVLTKDFTDDLADACRAYGLSDSFCELARFARKEGYTFMFINSLGYEDEAQWKTYPVELGCPGMMTLLPMISTLHVAHADLKALDWLTSGSIRAPLPIASREERGYAIGLSNWDNELKALCSKYDLSRNFTNLCEWVYTQGQDHFILDVDGKIIDELPQPNSKSNLD